MKPAKILYIDGQGVSVTRFTLKVKDRSYPVKTLSYRPVMLSPRRFPAMITFTIGLILITGGYVKAISPSALVGFEEKILLPFMAIYAGLVVMSLSLIAAFMTRERYALQITTSEGVKNVVVSRKKSHITKIIHKLNFAASQHMKRVNEEEVEHAEVPQLA